MSGPVTGITPKLDKVPLDHFQKELQKDIDSHQIHDQGWEIKVRRYEIPYTGAAHTTLELHGPQRPDGTHFYADIDTFSMDHKGNATFYTPGSEMRMAIDQNRGDNWVTKDANLVQDLTLEHGAGTDMLLKFSRMAEQAKEFNAGGSQYHPFSWDGYAGMSKEEWANSNSGPRQILDNLGYDTKHIGGSGPHTGGTDLHNPEVDAKGNSVFYHWAAGADDDVSRDFKQKDPGFFESFKGNSAALVDNPDMLNKVNQLFTSLHPDYIAKTDPEMGGAQLAATPPKPGG